LNHWHLRWAGSGRRAERHVVDRLAKIQSAGALPRDCLNHQHLGRRREALRRGRCDSRSVRTAPHRVQERASGGSRGGAWAMSSAWSSP